MKPATAHAIAIAGAFAVIVAAFAAWIVNLRSGPRLGLEAGAMVLIVPLALVVLAAMWLVARAAIASRLRWGALGMTALCAAAAYVLVAVACGPVACFQTGPSRAMGWFLVGGIAAVALVHHVLLGWLARPAAGRTRPGKET